MSELSYTAKQAAEALGSSPAQARRYGAALEEVTGEPIARHPRDGRMYRRDQIETMLKAKGLVEANAGLTVTQALKLALGDTLDLAHAESAVGLNLPSEALSEALERALTRSLLPELQGLRAEVAALRSELAAARALSVEASGGIMNGVELQRQEKESWLTEMTGREFMGASERPVEVKGSVGSARSSGESLGEAEGLADGPVTRAVRWLERRLYGGKGN